MIAARIADNLARIRDRIAASATRCGREPDEVTLVAVTKYVGIEEARALVEAGCYDLGESRPQELWNKAQALGHPTARWHMIGHLQRNKVRRTVGCISKLHSGDSWRLLRAVNGEAAAVGLRLPVLLEVNISGDKSKYGFQPDEMSDVVDRASQLENLDVRGLMAMSALEGGGAGARKEFRGLRDLRDRLLESCPAEVTLDELSMGMSRDFEVGIEEGATIVRLGSALFDGMI